LPNLVINGAPITCSFGASPSTLLVPVPHLVTATALPVATIMDYAPITNVPTFGMCSSLANPTVASATTAAQGVLTPMPCVPATATPWVPGCTMVTIGGIPALNDACTLACSYLGVISISFAGQVLVEGT